MPDTKLKTPDITLAQILAALAFVGGQAVATGVIDNDTEKWVMQIVVTAVTAAWMIADAWIRHGRATGQKAEVAAPTIAVTPRKIEPTPSATGTATVGGSSFSVVGPGFAPKRKPASKKRPASKKPAR